MPAGNGSQLRVAVFASGSGSNFQALAEAVRDGGIPAEIALLVCDKPAAPVVRRAETLGVPTYLFDPKSYASREAYEEEIVGRLREEGVELIVLAGYMRIITDVLVKPYDGRMINVHPSLLPAFPGMRAVRQALEHGVKVAGATVHFVDGGLDSGPILAQKAVEIRGDDTEETLTARIHAIEHELLPQAVRWIAEGRVKLNGRNVTIRHDESEFQKGRGTTHERE
ncbi:phosphoribosylglycinamide formyltransferase [Cohnella lubricantis]|uniref:Phosphoribosylglycinamide formyltransferase n=1 Tax=Cohnella lubricantis TaxID=2163172 RepID=A0A841TFF6_9BACL|nr:phosphoribosylglycinamide formyltransferase [Cohnella lubricantis]MBB6678815.1 phosphoribosylglycinamide formyltransferase [Cohnella lubricantis]MBP2117342.1 phosphoribosylglycinamide formyltransferase-1 [Cohnella lubricantis]